MIAHKLIDIFLSAKDPVRHIAIEKITEAMKFDLGDISDAANELNIKDIGNMANKLNREQLFSMPYKSTLFEIKIHGEKFCYVVSDDKDSLEAKFIQITKHDVKISRSILLNKESGLLATDNFNQPHPITNNFYSPTRIPSATLGKAIDAWLFYLVIYYVMIISCSNIKMIDVPPSEKLNKKRKARGKSPLFTYKTLVIDTNNQTASQANNGGHHASPRVHLRRGHIRHYKSGLRRFIQPHVVGDKKKGIVHKDYRIKQLSDSDAS